MPREKADGTVDRGEGVDIISAMIRKYAKKVPAPVKQVSLSVSSKKRKYRLVRLNDDQYAMLRRNSLAISEDHFHCWDLTMDRDLILSSLSRTYAACKALFGERGRFYDDWKGAFSFPFLISFEVDEETVGYLMNLFNFKTSVEFRIDKLIPDEDETFERDIYHEPLEEFPRSEINYLINYLAGFLTGYFESVKDSLTEEFSFFVRSNLIVYGFRDGRFFDTQYEDDEEFYRVVQSLA